MLAVRPAGNFHMVSSSVAFAIALIVVITTTPMVRRLAVSMGAMDHPGERRAHAGSIPRLGGLAIIVGFFMPLLLLFGLETQVAQHFFSSPQLTVGLVSGGLLMGSLGVFDDIRGVRAWHKLWVQLAAAGIAFACGFRIQGVALPFVGNLDMGIFALPVTILWVVAIVNALNLIDGLDGLAGGVAFFACITNFAVGALHGDVLVMLLSASLGGALLGFLLYNFNPASIFMGDTGSLFLGFVLATTSILGASVKSSTAVAILVPLIALGVPIMDTLFAMGRRFLERRPIFAPDKGHIHHRLLAMGLTHRRAVLILYGLSILLTTSAILIAMGRNWEVGGALLLLSMAAIGLVRGLGNLQAALRRWQRKERLRSPTVERLRKAVPIFAHRIVSAREAAHIAKLLTDLAEAAELTALELSGLEADVAEHESTSTPPASNFAWVSPDAPPEAERDEVSASFPLPTLADSARLTFAWHSTRGDVSPEADILLQLIADAVETRLTRAEAARTAVSTGRLRPV